MGKRGPAPRPTHLRVLDGNPSRRPINDLEPEPSGRPEPPEYLSAAAREEWDRVTGAMPPSLYTAVDRALLAAWSVAVAQHQAAASEIEAGGHVMEPGEERPKDSPWKIWKDTTETLIKLSSKLGMSPADRSALRVSKAEKPGGKFAGLVGGRTR